MTSQSVVPAGKAASIVRLNNDTAKSNPNRSRNIIIGGAVAVVGLVGLAAWEESQPHFTIGAGESIIGVLNAKRMGPARLALTPSELRQDYLQAIDIAEAGKLRVYITDLGETPVPADSYKIARQYANYTNRYKIDVHVYAGDQIDCRWGCKFTPAPGSRPVPAR